ncbi:MAG: bifunctional metallophosphatase/5'-nucleotidase [Candidatus Binatia bacterium]
MKRDKHSGGCVRAVVVALLTLWLGLDSAWLPGAVARDNGHGNGNFKPTSRHTNDRAVSRFGQSGRQENSRAPQQQKRKPKRHDRRGRGEFTLTILHNNDGESALLPSGDEAGVARFATVVQREKRRALQKPKRGERDHGDKRGVIFVSSGDNFLASPAFTASLSDGVYYDAVALDLLGYDAIDLGNHDFDFGPDVLAEFIAGFRRPGKPPYLSSNLDFSGEPALQALADGGVIAKSIIVHEQGRKIGIIGATTENLPFISSPRDIIVKAVLPAVQAEVDRLENRGVKIIILISHLQSILEDIALARQLSGADVMIAGGGDELLANCETVVDCAPILLPTHLVDTQPMGAPDGVPDALFDAYPIIATDLEGNEVPVVTTSGGYGYLGRLVVEFDNNGNVVDWDGGPIRVVSRAFSDGVPENPRMLREVVQPVQVFVADLANNVIATSQVDLNGLRDPGVRTMETNEGNLIADSQLWQAQLLASSFGVDAPQVALQNGGGIRNDSIIPAGDITELDTFDMLPFANFVTVVPNVPRSQFKEILENAVSRVEFVDGRFAQVAGFSFIWNPAGAAQVLNADGTVAIAGTRVTNVVLDDGTVIVSGGGVQTGNPIDIAIIDFLARGSDAYPFRGARFTVLGVSDQQALFNYIAAQVADGGLGGLITAGEYPEGGEGRIIRISPVN